MIKYGTNNIGKIYFGSNLIGKAYFGSNLVYSSGSGPAPQPTNIAYIRGGADGSYIDTGITPDDTVKVIVWARNFNPGGGAMFGSHIAANDSEFLLGSYSDYHVGEFRVDYGNSISHFDDNFTKLSNYHKYELYQGTIKVDDVTVGTVADTFNGNSFNIHLLGQNRNGSHINCVLPIDICACKIYKNGALVRDFSPVQTPSVGLYDAVSNTMFTNAGSGSLVYGTFNQSAYTQLDYVELTGAQYFDTGVVGSSDLNYVATFTPNLSTTYPILLGSQTSSSSKRLVVQFGDTTTIGRHIYFVFGATSKTVNNSSTLNNTKVNIVKNAKVHTAYKNSSTRIGSQQTFTDSDFVGDYSVYVGTLNNAGTPHANFCSGRLHYLGLSGSSVVRNFVPAKVNNVAGMYDTYNDVFYPSISGTAFIAGNEL